MNNNKLKINGTMLSCLIIIISFVYAINIQPKVIGDYENLKDISNEKIDEIATDNPVLCNHNAICEDKIPKDIDLLYRCSCDNDFTNFFYTNNILRIISYYMIKMNKLSDFRDFNSINLR
jgi:hypothetical protein